MITGQTIFLGPHAAKTGGTSIWGHASHHLGAQQVVNYGPAGMRLRLMSNLPMFEEMTPAQRGSLRLIFGHGVGEQCLAALPHPDVALFCVSRDPYRRALSQFKHRVRTGTLQAGAGSSFAEFLTSLPSNPFATQLVTRFPSLAGRGDLLEQAHRVLQTFRFVLATEDLDAQAAVLYRVLGVPTTMERLRVYPETVDVGTISAEEVRAAHPVDTALNRAIAGHRVQDGDVAVNPFGYSASAARDAIEALQATHDEARLRATAGAHVVTALIGSNSLLAAKAHVSHSGRTGAIAEAVLAAPDVKIRAAAPASMAMFRRAQVFLDLGRQAEAEADLREALRLQPSNAEAALALGEMLLARAAAAEAVPFMQVAAAGMPWSAAAQNGLAVALEAVGQYRKALAAITAAVRLAPGNHRLRRHRRHLWWRSLVPGRRAR